MRTACLASALLPVVCLVACSDGLLAVKCLPPFFRAGTSPFPDGQVGVPYNWNPGANLFCEQSDFSIESGQLPPGIQLTSIGKRANFSGSPTQAGFFLFVLALETESGRASEAHSITIHEAAAR